MRHYIDAAAQPHLHQLDGTAPGAHVVRRAAVHHRWRSMPCAATRVLVRRDPQRAELVVLEQAEHRSDLVVRPQPVEVHLDCIARPLPVEPRGPLPGANVIPIRPAEVAARGR